MKTKLLKKVRRRFAILEVTHHGKNDFEYIDTKDLSYPFYVIVDTNSAIYYLGVSQRYKWAHQELLKIVLNVYKDKSTIKLKATKVYYNK